MECSGCIRVGDANETTLRLFALVLIVIFTSATFLMKSTLCKDISMFPARENCCLLEIFKTKVHMRARESRTVSVQCVCSGVVYGVCIHHG